MSDQIRMLVSGGGTGGHIFPAVSIANAVKEKVPSGRNPFCRSRRSNGNGESPGGRI